MEAATMPLRPGYSSNLLRLFTLMKMHLASKVRVQMIDTNLPTRTPRSENAKKSKNEEK